jgi:hypothetical protein
VLRLLLSTSDNDVSTAGPSPTSGEWDEILGLFRALGGVAENITLGLGPFGRGLFPQDPAEPFLLRLPDNLLFPVDDVEFADGAIRIRNDTGAGSAERDFFSRYQCSFSWGGAGKVESESLIAMFDSLPPELRTMLIADFGLNDAFEGSAAERAQRRFLASRSIKWNKAEVLMPLIELANYGASGRAYTADPQGRLQIQGHAQGEILVNYGPHHDPFDIFRTFGFVTARPRAFSRPMSVKVGTAKLEIDCKTAGTIRAGFRVPEMKVDGGGISLSHLMIGNANSPRVPRGIFYALMRDAGASGAEQAFDLILHANKTKFLHLLEVLEPHHGEMVAMLKRTAYFQLEAMAHCVGTREL